jgi:hypothetical protein
MEKVTYTAEQLAEWKKKYGENLSQVDFENHTGEKFTAVIVKPSRTEIAAFTNIAQKDGDKGLVFLVKTCMVWSNITDVYAQDNADCFYAVAKNIQDLITVRNEEVKKL